MNRHEAEHVLRPHYARLHKVINAGFESWRSLPPAFRAKLSPRTRASVIRDGMVSCARHEFADLDGVAVREIRGNFFVVLDDRILVRFKKHDKRGRPRNILTKLQFKMQMQQFQLFRFEPALVVAAGYQLNAMETAIESRLVSCVEGSRRLWLLEIPADLSDDDIVEFPSKVPTRPVAPRIVPKVAEVERDGVDGTN